MTKKVGKFFNLEKLSKKFLPGNITEPSDREMHFKMRTTEINGVSEAIVEYIFSCTSDKKFGELVNVSVRGASRSIGNKTYAKAYHQSHELLVKKAPEAIVKDASSDYGHHISVNDKFRIFSKKTTADFGELELLYTFKFDNDASTFTKVFYVADKRMILIYNEALSNAINSRKKEPSNVDIVDFPNYIFKDIDEHTLFELLSLDDKHYITVPYDFDKYRQFNLFNLENVDYNNRIQPLYTFPEESDLTHSYSLLNTISIYNFINKDSKGPSYSNSELEALKNACEKQTIGYEFDGITIHSEKMYNNYIGYFKKGDSVRILSTGETGEFLSYGETKLESFVRVDHHTCVISAVYSGNIVHFRRKEIKDNIGNIAIFNSPVFDAIHGEIVREDEDFVHLEIMFNALEFSLSKAYQFFSSNAAHRFDNAAVQSTYKKHYNPKSNLTISLQKSKLSDNPDSIHFFKMYGSLESDVFKRHTTSLIPDLETFLSSISDNFRDDYYFSLNTLNYLLSISLQVESSDVVTEKIRETFEEFSHSRHLLFELIKVFLNAPAKYLIVKEPS